MRARTFVVWLVTISAVAIAPRPGMAQEQDEPPVIDKPDFSKPPPPKDPLPADGGPSAFILSADETVAFFQARVRANPKDYVSYRYLGEAYERKARESGDLVSYEKAEEAYRKSLEIMPGYNRSQAGLAAVLCSRHKFPEGLKLASEIVAREPKNIDAISTLGDAQLELGRYAEAEATYKSLAAITRAPAVLARLANLADQTGNPDVAIALMTSAIDEILKTGGTAKDAGWYIGQKAEITLNTGQVDAAEKLYAAVPSGIDAYHDATAGLARIAAMRGKLDEAIVLYEKAVAIGPDPHMLAALGDLYVKTGKPDKATPLYEQLLSITAGKNEYLRARAMFLAEHDRDLPEALALAEKDFKDRKDVLGWDALAWALYKNGKFDEAAKAIDQALKLGTKDANVAFHAGMIQRKLGNRDEARKYLKRALGTNPEFSPTNAAEARKALADLEK